MNYGWSNSNYYGYYGPSTRWRYHRRYYDYGYDRRNFAYYDQVCHYSGNNNGAAIGAILGAIVGGVAANDDDVGVGILLGAGFGALLGSSASHFDDCDRGQYQYAMNYAFEHNEPYYWANPQSGIRGSVVIRDSWYTDGNECRSGDAEIYMPDGTYTNDEVTMCRDNYGEWQVSRYQ